MSYALICAMNPRLLLVLLLVGTGVVRSAAQGAPGPDIKGATEYEFPTTDGAAYLLEGTVNGQTWTTLAGPIFGDGKPPGPCCHPPPPASANSGCGR